MTVAEVLTATVRISAPPADVFPYFTDPALMGQWIGAAPPARWLNSTPTAAGRAF